MFLEQDTLSQVFMSSVNMPPLDIVFLIVTPSTRN